MSVKIGATINSQGYQITVGNKNYSLSLHDYWKDMKEKGLLIDNITYAKTAALRTLVEDINYDTYNPFFKEFIDSGIKGDLPRIADIKGEKTQNIIAEFDKSTVKFQKKLEQQTLSEVETDNNHAVIGMSMGKDSLLSFGLAEEIGLRSTLIFFEDMAGYNSNEHKIKTGLINNFTKQFNKNIISIKDNTDLIYYSKNIKNNFHEYDGTNAILCFALQMIPLANNQNSRYILLGNEQNHNDFYINNDGYKTYPSFDQTSEYMQGIDDVMKKFTNDNINVMSIIEPIYNLAEMKILKNRYPQYLKYVMSCSSKKLAQHRWCGQCPMCAKAYILACAVGFSPKDMGHNHNMFLKENAKLYPMFSKPIRPYEKPKEQRDEQLFAFYLAYKHGAKGELIDEFKKNFLVEAKEREEEFHKRFFGIHTSLSMPRNINSKITSILKEELN
ncbi:hypothetical protein ISS05_01485 [Candidatus Woesearchaeota archaeon]|nr:hypothetical protein [Candidatus Woesearchaeota archaeon]